MPLGLVLRIVAATLALVMTSGAATLGRACCLFAAEDVVTCCEQRGETCPRLEQLPCCDDTSTATVSADRAERHSGDAVQLFAVSISLRRLVGALPESVLASAERWLPPDLPRFRSTSRLLL